ncbi:MAG TPA: magnesium transporter CorA, partial [Rhodocyclaceae bacterium]|nr:magnesium transporter CorA [Rhodocyclaceae bacterium]
MTDNSATPEVLTDDDIQASLHEVQALLVRQKRVENLVHRQDMPRHELVENLVHKQHLNELKNRLGQMSSARIARILEALPQDDGLLVWELIGTERGEEVLNELSEAVRETLAGTLPYQRRPIMLNAFELNNGRLRQIPIENRGDLAATKPIWVDLIAPTALERQWVEEIFGLV